MGIFRIATYNVNSVRRRLRRKHPGGSGRHTFFDYRVPEAAKRGLGRRIDHIPATPSLASRVRSCHIDRAPHPAEKPSNHTILSADFATD